jgi:uncharacterized spore protein YtfJ
MDVQEVLSQARDAMTVKRVFGDPYEKNGLTVIPVAAVRGGAGGGGGEGPGGEGRGSGSGFGVAAKPAGAYVIRGEHVRWRPAVDVNRIVAGGQLVAIVAILTVRSLLMMRASRHQPRKPAQMWRRNQSRRRKRQARGPRRPF